MRVFLLVSIDIKDGIDPFLSVGLSRFAGWLLVLISIRHQNL